MQVDDTEVVKFLLTSEVIPLCLRIMGTGRELSKTVCRSSFAFAVMSRHAILSYSLTCFWLLEAASILANVVIALTEQPSTRLLKHVICCYLRLTDDPRACTALQTHLPEALRNGTFGNCLKDDPAARHFLQQLLDKLASSAGAPHPGIGPAVGGSHRGSSQAGPSHAMM
ncbi:hypothetical protein HU200_039008 [Digitaria exilis]|uniref:CCR4-NOT transcription complex subunit 9 n=1 Tax=Digitaria exilis TaxID=1010633 RepID=A0A835ELJ3_9POAL|nr:hypothetical protein HU200_039008 [Digitaria exilis]